MAEDLDKNQNGSSSNANGTKGKEIKKSAGNKRKGKKPARKRAKKNRDGNFSASSKVTQSAPVSRRPRRSAAKKAMNRLQDLGEIEGSYSQPSASHYVGYVEEGETVDMIMKKFQKLEEVKQKFREQQQKDATSTSEGAEKSTHSSDSSKSKGANEAGDDVALTTEQLEEVFKKTSNFTVKSAVKANEMDDIAAISGLRADELGWENAAELLELHDDDEGQYFWAGGVDDDSFWDEIYQGKHKKKKRRKKIKVAKAKHSRRAMRRDPNRLPGELGFSGVTKIAFVSDAKGRYITAIKKTRWKDPNAIVYTKVPYLKVEDRKYPEDPPVPRSWAKQIMPYVPASIYLKSKEELTKKRKTAGNYDSNEDIGSSFYKVKSILDFDLESVLPPASFNNVPNDKDSTQPIEEESFNFIGITMDPPWKIDVKHTIPAVADEQENDRNVKSRNGVPDISHRNGTIVPEDLKKLNLTKKLMPTGIVFIWVKKTQIGRVVKAMETHDLYYVENLCWLKESVSNDFSYSGSPYFRDSHETMLIFRKGHITPGGNHAHEKLELRHQRTEDSVMLPAQQGPEHTAKRVQSKPDDFVQMLVERMLPRGFLNKNGKKYKRGRFLELWASPWSQKKGWTTVVEEEDLEAHYKCRPV